MHHFSLANDLGCGVDLHIDETNIFPGRGVKELLDTLDKMNVDINWQDGDDIDVNLAGTFAADRFIVIVNRTKSSTSKHNML